MSFSPLEYLRHMLVEADFLIGQTRTLSRTEFLGDEVLRRALVRSIEIIGEAAKQVPPDFRARHPQIDWRVMAGMRDRLIHGYSASTMTSSGTWQRTRHPRSSSTLSRS